MVSSTSFKSFWFSLHSCPDQHYSTFVLPSLCNYRIEENFLAKFLESLRSKNKQCAQGWCTSQALREPSSIHIKQDVFRDLSSRQIKAMAQLPLVAQGSCGYPITWSGQGRTGWGLEQPVLVESVPGHGEEIGTVWPLRSIQTQTILGFYDF